MRVGAAPDLVARLLDVVNGDDVGHTEEPRGVVGAELGHPVVKGAVEGVLVVGVGHPGKRAGGVEDGCVHPLFVEELEAGLRLVGRGDRHLHH